jgi:hypothetical protein
MPFLRRRWPWLLVLLFPLLPLWRAVFVGEAIGPFDQIRQMAPWNGSAPDRPFDVLQADAVLQFYPWRDMVFEAWGRGELPLWNPYQLAGTPLLANSQSGGFYPPHILVGLLHVPTQWAITLLAWFHLALAGLGVMALARRLGATPAGGAIGGTLFSGSAFMLAWTALPSVISTVAWIPWVLAGVYGLFEGLKDRESEEDSPPEAPQRRTASTLFRSAALTALSTGMMLLAGHLQYAAYGFFAAILVLVLLYGFSLFDKSDKPQGSSNSFGLGVLALAIGGGLAAPQLLPVLEYSQFSHRRNVPTEEGYQAYVAGAIAPFELVGLIYPTAVGLPFEFAPDAKPLSRYWPALVKQGANFAEGAIGIGPLALFGLLMFPWRRAPKRLWVPLVALGVLAFLLALGTALNKPFYFLIPGWSSTGSPGRIGVLFLIGVATFAALGITLKRESDNPRREFAASAVLLLLTIAGALVQFQLSRTLSPRFEGMDPSILTSSVRDGGFLGAMSIFVMGAYCLFAYAKVRSKSIAEGNQSPLGGLALGALTMVAFMPLYLKLIPTSQPIANDTSASQDSLSGSNTIPTGRSAFINGPWELVVAAPATMPPNTASILRIPDLAGYDSLLHKDTHLFLGDVNGQDPAPPANGNIQYIKPTADPLKLAEAGVAFVYSRSLLPWDQTKSEQLRNGLFRYRLDGLRASVQGANATRSAVEVTDGYSRQTLSASGPGTLVVKDRLMPGWTAFVDGKPAPWTSKNPWKSPDGRTIQLWREIELPDGDHEVEFRYEPPGLRAGSLTGLVSLAAFGGLSFLGYRGGRRTRR